MLEQVSQRLESFLTTYGWSFRRAGDGEWQTGFQGQERTYPMRISATDSWVSFQVHPFMKLQIDWESWPEIAPFFLEMNQACPLVKLAMHPDGHMGLTFEILANRFDYETFSDSLGILGHYADQLYDEILEFLDGIGFRYTTSLRLLT